MEIALQSVRLNYFITCSLSLNRFMTVKGGEVYLSCNDSTISMLDKLSNSVIRLLSLYRSPKYSDSLVRKGFDVA